MGQMSFCFCFFDKVSFWKIVGFIFVIAR